MTQVAMIRGVNGGIEVRRMPKCGQLIGKA